MQIIDSIVKTLIVDNRWLFYVKGLGFTLTMTVMALLVGIVIGMLIAIVKVTYATSGNLVILNTLCNLYTTVIRGTPVLLQLIIIYFGVFANAPLEFAVPIAALAFGLNSGAYVSEIMRAGILSVDKGQTEAGRTLGLNGKQTMRLIILPQAIKNILPALFNEFISLLKETSVASYIAISEITRAGDLIRSRVWSMTPMIVSALLYLSMVIALTKIQQLIERRLAASDRS